MRSLCVIVDAITITTYTGMNNEHEIIKSEILLCVPVSL